MNKYNVQPLDLMQLINTKYHDPFIHELLEFESGLDTEKFVQAVDELVDVFPQLKLIFRKQKSNKEETKTWYSCPIK